MPPTPLETMIKKTFKEPEQYRFEFYKILKDSEVFVPLSEEQSEMKEGTLSLQMALDHHEELIFVMFSSEKTLKGWIDKDTHYSLLPSIDLFNVALEDQSKIVLDPAGPYSYEFTLKEIQFILSDKKEDSQLKLSSPTEDTSALEATIKKYLGEIAEIKEAYLVIATQKKQKQLILGLYFHQTSEEKVQAIIKNVEIALKDKPLVVLSLDQPEFFKEVSSQVEAFYMDY